MSEENVIIEKARFSGAEWFDTLSKAECIVGGAGGIGSWLGIFLSRIMGNVHLVDNDTVEKVNLAGQAFCKSFIGMSKVVAVDTLCREMGSNGVSSTHIRIENLSSRHFRVPMFFSCFDNIEARRTMFANFLSSDESKVFIDGRLNAEHWEMYIVNKNNKKAIEAYKETLFDDSEVEELSCTYKQTSHVAADLASNMVKAATNYAVGNPMPFKTKHFVHIYTYEYENI